MCTDISDFITLGHCKKTGLKQKQLSFTFYIIHITFLFKHCDNVFYTYNKISINCSVRNFSTVAKCGKCFTYSAILYPL